MKAHFSKLDVARRQLETAIEVFFRNGDPISIHTLACASQEILEAIAGKQKVDSTMKDLLKSIKPEKVEEVRKRLNAPKNFFKHGHSDPQATLEFNPEISTHYIWDACNLYANLTKERVKLFSIFLWWFAIKNKEAFEKVDNLIKENGAMFDIDNRLEFLQAASAVYDLSLTSK